MTAAHISRTFRMSPILLGLVAVLTALVILLPIVIVPPMALSSSPTMTFPPPELSLRWFEQVLGDPKWQERLTASVQVATATSVVATTLGTLFALGLQRSRIRGKKLIYGMVLAPLIVPTVVIGTGLYFTLVRGWVVGPIVVGGHLTGSALALIMAHTALAIPLSFITVSTSLATVDRNLELAAASLGADPVASFRRITFPLILPGVVAGLVLSFLTSWDEAVVATFLSSPRFSTVPVELFAQVRFGVEPSAAAVSTLIVGVTALILILSFPMVRRVGRA